MDIRWVKITDVNRDGMKNWVNTAAITRVVDMGVAAEVHFVGGSWIRVSETADALIERMP